MRVKQQSLSRKHKVTEFEQHFLIFYRSLSHAQCPESLLQLFTARPAIVEAHYSGKVWNHNVVYGLEEYWVVYSVFEERVAPNSDVVFPAANEKVPTYFRQ